MKKTATTVMLVLSMLASTVRPAMAQVYHGAHGGAAVRTPHGGAVRAPSGAAAGAVHGPYGGAAAGVRGPYGGTAVHGQYNGNRYYGGNRYYYGGNRYYYGGRAYARPYWSGAQVGVYQRNFYGYPGWRPYGYYGLAAPLVGYSALGFLSGALLVGTFAAASNQTVYVYIVQENGMNVEYRVDSGGNVLSRRVVE